MSATDLMWFSPGRRVVGGGRIQKDTFLHISTACITVAYPLLCLPVSPQFSTSPGRNDGDAFIMPVFRRGALYAFSSLGYLTASPPFLISSIILKAWSGCTMCQMCEIALPCQCLSNLFLCKRIDSIFHQTWNSFWSDYLAVHDTFVGEEFFWGGGEEGLTGMLFFSSWPGRKI